MLNSVFARGSEAAGGIDYGLSKYDANNVLRSVEPVLRYGNPEHVKKVVRTLNCRQRYTAGVLRLVESNLPEHVEHQAMQDWLRVTYAGLDPCRFAVCFVRHQDKGGTELHYWTANVDLKTGKRINAYYHRADLKRMRLWVQHFNDLHNLADPNDPRRWRLHAPPKKDAPETYRVLQEKLLVSMQKMALAGVVKSRADIEAQLTRAGWSIGRRTKSFISVTHARLKKPIRLTGKMFSEGWKGALPADAIERLAREWAAQRRKRMRDTATELIKLIEQRSAYNRRRYGGEELDDPLLQRLIALRDSPAEPTPREVLANLQADIDAMRARHGAGGVSLRALGAQTRSAPAPQPSTAVPTLNHKPGGPRL